jgi:hypothetical protein
MDWMDADGHRGTRTPRHPPPTHHATHHPPTTPPTTLQCTLHSARSPPVHSTTLPAGLTRNAHTLLCVRTLLLADARCLLPPRPPLYGRCARPSRRRSSPPPKAAGSRAASAMCAPCGPRRHQRRSRPRRSRSVVNDRSRLWGPPCATGGVACACASRASISV